MILYFLKVSLRNLSRERLSTLIKILGLSLGLLTFLVLFLYVNYEKNYNKHFSNYENVVRLGFENRNQSGQVWNGAFVPVPLVEKVTEECPEIEYGARVYYEGSDASFYIEDRVFESELSFFADYSFFEIFNTDLLLGNAENVLSEPNTVALCETMAKVIFGNENPIGKTIKYQNQVPLRVSGVFKDFPKNSSIPFEVLISYTTPNYLYPGNNDNWDLHFVRAYFLMKPGTNYTKVEQKIEAIAEANKPLTSKNSKWNYFLEPVEDIHLETKVVSGKESSVSLKTINLLMFIAFFILLIALINHLNLSVTQILKRIKQIGVEKASGQKLGQLVGKSTVESTLVFFVSLIIAMGLLLVILPHVNNLLNKDISLASINYSFIIQVFFVFFAFIVLGSYGEIFFVSRISLSKAISGKIGDSGGKRNIRKGLISFQFFVSLLLIFVTLVFYQQTNHMFNRNLGMENSNVIVVKGKTVQSWGNNGYMNQVESFKQELLKNPAIKGVSTSNVIPGNWAFTDGVAVASDHSKRYINNAIVLCDADYIDTYNIKLLAGNGFPKNRNGGRNLAIINKKNAKNLGFESPEDAIGKTIIREFFQSEYEVVGVCDNFAVSNLVSEIPPTTLYLEPNENRFYSICYSGGNASEVLSSITSSWERVFNEQSCRYFFLNNVYKKVYSSELLQVKIFSVCALLAIVIACIGLFGLSYYSIVQKTKEIGVRKVNGAKSSNILTLIYKEYFLLILISSIPALTLAYVLSVKWLEKFYYKIEIGSLYVLVPIVLMVIVTFITISYHTLKSISKNPVEALRYE